MDICLGFKAAVFRHTVQNTVGLSPADRRLRPAGNGGDVTPTVADAPAFTDVAAGAWYSDAVAWAAKTGIISGYGGGTFAKKVWIILGARPHQMG